MQTRPSVAGYRKRGMKLETRNTLLGISFILPNFLGFLIFVLAPVIFSVILSFANWDGFNAMTFAGLENFRQLLKDRVFRSAFVQTLHYALFTVVFSTVFALGMAVLLNKPLKGRNFFRSAVFFPYIASVVAVGVVWNSLFQKDYGPINQFLRLLGILNPPGWVISTRWAIYAVIIVSIWKNTGYFMMVYLAGLQDISATLYEAATIDGAGEIQQFFYVTLPNLRNTTFFVVLMLTINSFKEFGLIYTMTEGGPGISTTMLAQYIYDQSFSYWNYGKASAASMVLFGVVGIITMLQLAAEHRQSR